MNWLLILGIGIAVLSTVFMLLLLREFVSTSNRRTNLLKKLEAKQIYLASRDGIIMIIYVVTTLCWTLGLAWVFWSLYSRL